MKRRHISYREKLAAALATMLRPNEDGALVPVIPYDHRKSLTADQIISLFHFDHYPVRHEQGGADAHYNLVPRLIKEHRDKTAKKDRPESAKSKRLVSAEQEHSRRMMLKVSPKDQPEPMRRQAAKMKSRGFQGHRKFDGTPVWKAKT